MSRAKTVLLWFMGIFYVVAGLNHFVSSGFYVPMMPPYLPAHMALIYLSGVAEIVLGAAVLVPSLRPLAAWGIALHNVPLAGAREGAGIWNWVRLPFQGVLITWAWWYTHAADAPALARPAAA